MGDRRYRNVIKAVVETPWAILPDTYRAIVELVELRAAGERLTDEEIQARIGSGPAQRSGYTSGGAIAVIPLYGVLIPRATLFSEISGGTSLQRFGATFEKALADPQIGAILLDVASPGGSVSLVAETAAKVRAARGVKPVWAIANTTMASAAYHIACQAQRVIASPSALVGSIGVIWEHTEISRRQQIEGDTTTVITAGERKGDGNAYEPLTDDARASMQQIVDELYEGFVGDVAAARGTTPAKVRAGYGRGAVLAARQALTEGLVDEIDTFENTLARLAAGGKPKPAGRRATTALPEPAAAAAADDDAELGLEPPDGHEDERDDEAAAALASLRSFASDIQTEAAIASLRALATDIRPDKE